MSNHTTALVEIHENKTSFSNADQTFIQRMVIKQALKTDLTEKEWGRVFGLHVDLTRRQDNE